MQIIVYYCPYITLHTLLTFPTGFFNDNLHQIKLFKTNASNNLKVIYKLDRREKLYVLFTVVIYKVSNIVFFVKNSNLSLLLKRFTLLIDFNCSSSAFHILVALYLNVLCPHVV